MARILHWFRNDLRLYDNPSLTAAITAADGDVITCFCITEKQWQDHDMAPIQADFLLRNLTDLRLHLERRHIPLFILRCDTFDETPETLLQFAQRYDCQSIYCNEEYGINERRRDKRLQQLGRQRNITVRKFRDQSIAPVGLIKTQKEEAYTVFTPFKRKWWEQHQQFDLELWPASKGRLNKFCGSTQEPIELATMNTRDSSAWPAGETAAHKALEDFIESRAMDYRKQRDFPAIEGTSRLSPYLALGVLSGKQCFLAARQFRKVSAEAEEGVDCWINELIWRDFYIHILYHFPRVSMHRAFKPETEQLPWRDAPEDFEAWCNGRTGIPIVDAAMRQLNQSGWMHNRLRMICAMFLTKNLLIDWRKGEGYFMRNLIDGYLPANNGGWQWSASTGTDAAPYFRIFNPVIQGERFDPEGEFVRRYVPELADRPSKSVHQPLDQPLAEVDYPLPIVDLKNSRVRAIEAFKNL